MRPFKPALAVALLLLSVPAMAQPVVRPPQGDYSCTVTAAQPCRGRVDFDKGQSYEFRIAGPGKALILNEGNRRCLLEYSATASALASTGKELNLPPGQTMELAVPDAQGLIVRFFNRGLGSTRCDLAVRMAG